MAGLQFGERRRLQLPFLFLFLLLPVLLYVHRDHKDSNGRGAQDVHLDLHTAPEFWNYVFCDLCVIFRYWAIQAGLLTPLTFARHRLSPLAAFTSGAYFLHNGRR